VIDTLTWRPVTVDDVPALTRFWNVLERHDGWRDLTTEEETHEQLVRGPWDMSLDSLAAVAADGEIAGLTTMPPPPPGGHVVYVGGGVVPPLRGQGIGRRLLAWAVERAVAQHKAAAATNPWELHLGAADTDKQTPRLVARFGLEPVRYWYEMDRGVADPIPDSPLPDGLRAVTYDPALNDVLYDAHMAAFSDHWGFDWRPKDEFLKRFASVAFRPEQSAIAVAADDSVAGYLFSTSYDDPSRMTMATIGTLRAWRKKGVASALMATALRLYAEAGVTTATLGVDTNNPTGALRVYERIGFRPILSATTFSKSITSG
jgi:ribosomal protein S18 acetylase RimI-like enzyme